MPERVLIVDDHASFRAAARAMLEADGFEVVDRLRFSEVGGDPGDKFVPGRIWIETG